MIAALARALMKTGARSAAPPRQPHANRSAPQQVLLLLLAQLAVIPQLGEGLPFDRMPGGDGATALELGIELRAEQDGDVGDPHPDQEDDDAGQAAVDLVVVTEVRHVQGEQGGSDQPERDGYEAA